MSEGHSVAGEHERSSSSSSVSSRSPALGTQLSHVTLPASDSSPFPSPGPPRLGSFGFYQSRSSSSAPVSVPSNVIPMNTVSERPATSGPWLLLSLSGRELSTGTIRSRAPARVLSLEPLAREKEASSPRSEGKRCCLTGDKQMLEVPQRGVSRRLGAGPRGGGSHRFSRD